MFIIQESWLTTGNEIHIEGYQYFRNDRLKNKKARRGSGGVVVFFKNTLRAGIERIKSHCFDNIWIKLDKSFFNLECDLYKCCTYLPPFISSYIQKCSNIAKEIDIFDNFEREIQKYDNLGNVMIIGDLNSRIGTLYECLTNDNFNDHHSDEFITIRDRRSQDKNTNNYGKLLLNLLNKSHMLVLNGRHVGDLNGKFTCTKYNGRSSIDMCIVQERFV